MRSSKMQLDKELQISERAKSLLKHLVELYIQHGQPVGSKTLAQKADQPLSPATIPKVMGDLEAKGYVHSPHTSAGRVPTSRGLRLFVDNLLTVHPLENEKVQRVQAELHPHQPYKNLITSASSLLSEITQMVAVVTLPKVEKTILKHVEFLPLRDNRVLVVLVINECEVQNRIILTDKPYTSSELSQASNFLMEYFIGKDLKEAREDILKAMHQDRQKADSLMRTVLDVSEKAFIAQPVHEEYVMAGEFKLFSQPEPKIMENLQQLFQVFNEKRQILHLLDGCLRSDGVQLFIGEESGYSAFQGCSVVTSRYQVNGDFVGVLGVIGPTRMQYDRIIPIVDLTAKLLGSALNPKHESPY